MFTQLKSGFDTVLIDEAAQVYLPISPLYLPTPHPTPPGHRGLDPHPAISPVSPLYLPHISQAIEVSTLIPLKYACRRLILVGDPSQLPATVFSEPAQHHNYEQGLFQRLQLGGQRVHMLNMQYRMHPDISVWPGKRFYDGEG